MSETSEWPGPGGKNHPDLTLSGVVAHLLPLTLATQDEPDRYTVLAAFDRRPLPREVALIQGRAAHEELADAGYGQVTLRVVDRRLEIGMTSLAELKSGLAARIASILHDASVLIGDQDDARIADLKLVGEREAHRAESVLHQAAEVVFARANLPALPQAI